jgi:hypothetical protein
LIAVILILTAGIAVSGWQDDTNEENSGDNGNNTENADNNIDTTLPDEDDAPPLNNTENEQKLPEYISYLTGLKITEEVNASRPFAFVMTPSAPLYGISDAELVIEIPTEAGMTRLLVYNDDITELGKIGALSPTRDFISDLTKFFGGILVANGEDDIVDYDSFNVSLHVDVSESKKYYYTENAKNIYTNSEMLDEYCYSHGIDKSTVRKPSLPFEFCEYGQSVSGNTSAAIISIPYASDADSTFTYDKNTSTYVFSKGGRDKIDMLSGKVAAFTNVFVLFADTTTYEKSDGVESITDTATSGTGYYVSMGKLTEIRWSVSDDGSLSFKTLDGETLIVNRGNSYIGYYKSASSDAVYFE